MSLTNEESSELRFGMGLGSAAVCIFLSFVKWPCSAAYALDPYVGWPSGLIAYGIGLAVLWFCLPQSETWESVKKTGLGMVILGFLPLSIGGLGYLALTAFVPRLC